MEQNIRICFLLACLCIKVLQAVPSEGKEIADRFGDDLSFASKQFIRGFTAIFAPLLDTAQELPKGFSKIFPGGGYQASGIGQAGENFRKVILRDGVNALGKGVKASATILSSPARVAGTGIEEARKIGRAGVESRLGEFPASNPGSGKLNTNIDDGAKIASTLLNTTASEFSQANLGAVLVEVALKNRIKDIANRTMTQVKSPVGPKIESRSVKEEPNSSSSPENEEQTPRPSRVDDLIEKFNAAVKSNDERITNALRAVLEQINPPKN